MTKKKWTDDEIDFLINNYHNMSRREISNRLGRTLSSVGNKCNEIGLRKAKNWTDNEIQFLKDNIHLGYEYVSKKLNRTISSLYTKCCHLGIGCNNHWTKEEDTILIENKYLPSEELAELLNKNIHAIHHRCHKLNINRKDTWTDDEVEYLIKYYGTLPTKTIMKKVNKSKRQVMRKITSLEGTTSTRQLTNHYTVYDIVEFLGVTDSAIYRWIKKNQIPHIKVSPKFTVFSENVFWNWLKDNLHKPNFLKIDDSMLITMPEWYVEEVRKHKKLNKQNIYKKVTTWTKYETTILNSMIAKGMSYHVIAKELNKPLNSTKIKVKRQKRKRKQGVSA